MAGNVWEWTNTALSDTETVHVIKGGCYNDPQSLLRSDLRLEAVPKDKFETIGFRCVKSA
jgi:formylglycine-generating enzyme required for sulfatase activity